MIMHLIKPGNYQYNEAFRKAMIPKTFKRVKKDEKISFHRSYYIYPGVILSEEIREAKKLNISCSVQKFFVVFKKLFKLNMLIIILILVDPEYCRGKRTQSTSDLELRINVEGRLHPRYENF